MELFENDNPSEIQRKKIELYLNSVYPDISRIEFGLGLINLYFNPTDRTEDQLKKEAIMRFSDFQKFFHDCSLSNLQSIDVHTVQKNLPVNMPASFEYIFSILFK